MGSRSRRNNLAKLRKQRKGTKSANERPQQCNYKVTSVGGCCTRAVLFVGAFWRGCYQREGGTNSVQPANANQQRNDATRGGRYEVRIGTVWERESKSIVESLSNAGRTLDGTMSRVRHTSLGLQGGPARGVRRAHRSLIDIH